MALSRSESLTSLVARRKKSRRRSHSGRGRCDRGHHFRYFKLDLVLLRSHGRKTTGVGRPDDLADGEREALSHGSGSEDDDHLIHLESCTHTPYLAHHCRRKLVGTLPWGIPTVVVYRQTGTRAVRTPPTWRTTIDES